MKTKIASLEIFPLSLSQSQQTMYPNNSNSHNSNHPWYIHHTQQTDNHPPLTHPHNNPQTPTHQQPPLPPPIFINPNPYTMQPQFSVGPQAHTPPWGKRNPPKQCYHGSLYGIGPPIYQRVAQQQQHQYQPLRPGPNRNQHTKGQKTEAQYINFRHASPRMISRDHSTSIHPTMGAFNTTGAGGVSRPPPQNLLMVDRNLTQRVRPKPYGRDRAAHFSVPLERDMVNPSVYTVPITGLEGKLIYPSIHYQLCSLKTMCSKHNETGFNRPCANTGHCRGYTGHKHHKHP